VITELEIKATNF